MPHQVNQQPILARLARSRRVRAFVLISVVLHVVFFSALLTSESFRSWMYSLTASQSEPPPPSDADVARAKLKLLKIYNKKFARTAGEMQAIREELARIDAEKLDRLRESDATRERLIAAGHWPTPDAPDAAATFEPVVDVTPPPVPLTELPPLPEEPFEGDRESLEEQLRELYRLHPTLEAEAGRLFERYHALEMSEYLDEPIPLSRSVGATRLDLPSRLAEMPTLSESGPDATPEQALEGYKKALIAAELETLDMRNQARSWLALARRSESEVATMFGEQYETIPKPVKYTGHFLDPRFLKKVSLDSLIDVEPPLGGAVGGEEGLLKSEWVSLNQWYIIGPFSHPGRDRRLEDLERVYPPEAQVRSGVDLDATYEIGTGENTRTLRWKPRTFGSVDDDGTPTIERAIRIEPYPSDNTAYGLWYFYTLVHSDVDMTVLGSFNSDDYGALWVNGEKIYESPPTTRPFATFTRDSFRHVTLKKGVNTFLFKLENAQGSTGFSALLMTYQDDELLAAFEDEE